MEPKKTRHRPPGCVLVTGASGNLGRKAVHALLGTDWCREILAVDRVDPGPAGHQDARLSFIQADFVDANDQRWRNAVERADAVVHLAARNPMPNASWSEATDSFDMTVNLVNAAVDTGVKRFVFASSNHVMGGYKDMEHAGIIGALKPNTPPAPGTKWPRGREWTDSTAYATAKLMGERVCAAGTAVGNLTCVSLRIGWCQPGENSPDTISSPSMPKAEGDVDEQAQHDERWFRNMWLSNRDFCALILSALQADRVNWPLDAIVVNGMSANSGMPWDLAPGRAWIGYDPQDDAWWPTRRWMVEPKGVEPSTSRVRF